MNAEVDISNKVLETGRLVLRPWKETDLDDFFEYASVPGVGEMAGWRHHESKEDSAEILGRFIKGRKTFALQLKDVPEFRDIPGYRPGRVIGSLGLETYEEDRFPEFAEKRVRSLGFVLAKPYWGRGLMPEAVRAALAYAFNDLKLDALLCGHYLWNKQAGRAQEKSGLSHYCFDTYPSSLGNMEDHEFKIMTKEAYKMDIKRIEAGGIGYLQPLEGSSWYFGIDYTGGDLYEAEELFNMGHRIASSRLIFVSYPEGQVFEPVKAGEGQYFGEPAFWDGKVYALLVDFTEKLIHILVCASDMSGAEDFAVIPLSEVEDCYNLRLQTWPLTLTRQASDNTFQVVWPEKEAFKIANTESLDHREGDVLVFSQWFEDPDYREETVLRRYPDGEVLEVIKGSYVKMPDGQNWVLA